MSINLRSTTKISLNDRFKSLRSQRNSNAGPSTSSAAASASRLNTRQGSVRNKRLALQMANRPSVQAALKIKNRSIKQRLGTKKGVQPLRRNQSVKSRLTLTPNVKKASPMKARLNRNNFTGGARQMKQRQQQQALVNIQQGLKRPFLKKRPHLQQRLQLQQQQPSTSNIGIQRQRNPRLNLRNKIGLVMKKQLLMRGKKFNKFNKNNPNNQNAKNNNKQMINRRAMINQRRSGNFVGKQKFAQRGKFGAGPRNQVRWQDKKNVNKDQLDKDLDAYMAKTKTHLDNDLDAYMAHMP